MRMEYYTGKHWKIPPKKGPGFQLVEYNCIVCGQPLGRAVVFGEHRPAEAHAACVKRGAANA